MWYFEPWYPSQQELFGRIFVTYLLSLGSNIQTFWKILYPYLLINIHVGSHFKSDWVQNTIFEPTNFFHQNQTVIFLPPWIPTSWKSSKYIYKLSTWCFEHSSDISCSLLVNPSHTDESWAGRNTCMWIYMYMYIYIYINKIELDFENGVFPFKPKLE